MAQVGEPSHSLRPQYKHLAQLHYVEPRILENYKN